MSASTTAPTIAPPARVPPRASRRPPTARVAHAHAVRPRRPNVVAVHPRASIPSRVRRATVPRAVPDGDEPTAQTPASSSAPAAGPRLILYTKPGCCLCEGLEEKLAEVMSPSAAAGGAMGDALREMTLETRDVSTDETWAAAYAMEVPVVTLATVDEDGEERETPLPRPAPRLNAARLAVRLGQDVAAARAGTGGARRGWAAGDVGTVPSQSGKTVGGVGWAVVSEKPF